MQQLIRWNAVLCKTVTGQNILLNSASTIDRLCRGKLLFRILSMVRQEPITLTMAINLMNDKKQEDFKAGRMFRNPDRWNWYYFSFVQMISNLGFHIELNGDEFEVIHELDL
jgi:hypothetical protein